MAELYIDYKSNVLILRHLFYIVKKHDFLLKNSFLRLTFFIMNILQYNVANIIINLITIVISTQR